MGLTHVASAILELMLFSLLTAARGFIKGFIRF